MSGIGSLAAGLLLVVSFVVYRFGGLSAQGPLDKVVQLVLLVPSVFFLSWFGSGKFKGDLASRILTKFDRIPVKRFLAVLVLFLLLFTIWMAYGPLEGIPKGGDEAAYFFQSRIYAGGELAAPAPDVSDPRAFFPYRHFLFRDGRWFIMYTPFHSVVMAPFSAVGIAPLLGPLEGLVSLIGMFLLIRLWAGERVARISTVLLLFSPFFLFMSGSFMAHNTNLMLITWSLYLISRRAMGGGLTFGLVGGFLLGLAVCTKPYPVIAWSIFLLVAILAGRRGNWRRILFPVAAGALLPVGLLLAANLYYTGNPLRTAYDLARGGSLLGFGPDKAWYPVYGDYAHTPLRGLMNLAQQIGTGSTILFGWPLISLLPALLALRAIRADRRVLWLFLPIVLFVPLMIIHYSPSIDYGPRHYYTFLPLIMLLSAIGLREGVRMSRSRWGTRGGSVAAMVTAGLFMITLLVYLPGGISLRSGPWQAIDREPARLADSLVIPPAIVFMQAGEHGYPNIMSGVNFDSPWLDGDVIFCAHQTVLEDREFMLAYTGRNAYLFWFDGASSHIDMWSEGRAEQILPTRDMEYHPFAARSGGAR